MFLVLPKDIKDILKFIDEDKSNFVETGNAQASFTYINKKTDLIFNQPLLKK